MARRAAKIDANQNEIVMALRAVGAAVAITSSLGKGFPDIVVGYRGTNYLIEIKDGNKPPSKQKLTHDEELFHEEWSRQAPIHVVTSAQEAVDLISS